jgi:putative two-component system response regulator
MTTDLNISTSKILIVDDEPANVALLEAILEQAGFTNVMSTGDSREVVGLFKAHQIDLILLDIRMPHLSGIDVLAQLADTIADGDWPPVLVLSAQTDDETRQKALESGAWDFINKPFKEWECLQRIHNLLRTRHYFLNQKARADELESLVRERTKELYASNLMIIDRLGRAGEYRDNETGRHVLRMAKACQMLALAAGLSEAHADTIRHAAPMHDLGKIGIPDHILLKPSKLDPAERRIMETHVEIGADILGDHHDEVLVLARTMAIAHHEKWDGTGYPKGLLGTDIPIEARIASICDVFDAVTSARPYKHAWTFQQARDFINEQAGHHFDPQLVVHFNRIIREIAALRAELPDEV